MDDETQLVHAWLDGTASDEDCQRLNDWIKASPDNARLFAELGLLHDQLQNHHASKRELSHAKEPRVVQSSRINALPSHRGSVVAALSVICSLVAVICLFWSSGQSTTPPDKMITNEFATPGSVSGEVLLTAADGALLQLSSETQLRNGTSIRTTGSTSFAEVIFQDGTRILIAGEAFVTVVSVEPKLVSVTQGSVSASVTPQPADTPMVLKTPLAQVDVLGTEFNLAASSRITDLQVNKGRVRLTRADGGQSLVVDQGNRAVARAASAEVEVSATARTMDVWEEDYEDGLPASCVLGRFTTENLPPGSNGAAADLQPDRNQEAYAIDHNDWLNGLFRVYDDSHLHVIFRMEQPNWINVFLLTRADDPYTSHVELHMCTQSPRPAAGQWHKAVIPLSTFKRKVNGKFTDLPPKNDQLCFGLMWSWVEGPREMTVDRAWVTRGGPGRVMLQPLEQNSIPSNAENSQGPQSK